MQQLSIFDEQENVEYKPSFRAYLNHTGKQDAREVFLGDYMTWMSRNLKEFRKSNRISPYQRLSESQQEQFTQYLFEVEKEC